jgi:flagellar biosynthetic protein FliP
MFQETRKKDLGLFVQLSNTATPKEPSDIPTTVLVPAFITSELKTAFEIAFLLYIPFLVIDMVVASILMSMGMMLLPPIMISLPFKLMLFVLADGWNMVVKSLVESF